MLNVRKCLALATLALCCLPFGLGLAAPKRIGLLPVKNFTGYTGKVDFGSIIEGEIVSRLMHNSNYTLVERSHLKEVLNELGYDLNTGYSDDISKQVANTAGLDYIITAEVTQATVAQQYIPLVGEQLKAKVGVRLIAIDKNDGRRIFDQTVEDTASKQDLSDLSAIAVIGALGGLGNHDDDRDSHRDDRNWHHDKGSYQNGQVWRDSRGVYHRVPPTYNRGPQLPPGYRPAPNNGSHYPNGDRNYPGGYRNYPGPYRPSQPSRPGDPNSRRSQQRPGDPNSRRSQQRPGDPNSYRNDRTWEPSYRPSSFTAPVTTVQATFVTPLPAASYAPKFVELPQVSAAQLRTVSTDSYLEKYGASLVADATRGAARKAMNQFEEFNPIVGTVIGKGDDEIYIDLGRKDGLQVGEKLNVFREGTPVKNAQGDIVLVPQKNIGKLKVTSVSEAASVCEDRGNIRIGDKVRRAVKE
jgi:hypothetical protein